MELGDCWSDSCLWTCNVHYILDNTIHASTIQRNLDEYLVLDGRCLFSHSRDSDFPLFCKKCPPLWDHPSDTKQLSPLYFVSLFIILSGLVLYNIRPSSKAKSLEVQESPPIATQPKAIATRFSSFDTNSGRQTESESSMEV